MWLPPSLTDQSLPGLPRGTLCYELELTDLVPIAGIVRVPNVMTVTKNFPAKNVAEFIIYIVKGTDVRHTAIDQIESAMK